MGIVWTGCLLFLGVLLACPPAHAVLTPWQQASVGKSPRIRVQLSQASPGGRLRGYDLRIFESKSFITQVLGKKWALKANPNRLSEWDFKCSPGKVHVRAVDGVETLTLREPVAILSKVGFLSYNNRPYREEFRIYSNGARCEVVNELEMESYLNGIVNAEFSSKWSASSVEAQVIAARTYALYQIQEMRRKKTPHFDVVSTVEDQAYHGPAIEDHLATRAVQNTRGVVLAVRGQEKIAPMKAFYHSTCGGQTELPENVWGQNVSGFKRQVTCGFCRQSPQYRWNVELSRDSFSELLIDGYQASSKRLNWPYQWKNVVQTYELADVRLELSQKTNRVRKIQTLWRRGVDTVTLAFSSVQLRNWLGPLKLRSTSFMVSAVPDGAGKNRWIFTGKGNGHGVGMCQYGAKGMGERGFSTQKILAHYYPGGTLKKIW